MNWREASLIVDRFIRLVDSDLNELKEKHVIIRQYERESQHDRAAVEKTNSDRLIKQIQTAMQSVMSIRQELNDSAKNQFDAKLEPARLRIQATLCAISSNNSPKTIEEDNPFRSTGKKSTNPNPFEDADDNLFDDCFEDESSQSMSNGISDYDWHFQQEQKQIFKNENAEAMRLQMEQVKSDVEATKKLETDIEDLNQIMTDLAQLVHSQNDMVDSIEEQVERSAQEVQKGSNQLRQAVKTNQAKYPLVAAAVGTVAVGGPVGLVAGSVIAGVGSGIVGAIMGIWGGRAIRQKVLDENAIPK